MPKHLSAVGRLSPDLWNTLVPLAVASVICSQVDLDLHILGGFNCPLP